jgi:hypothetical protein
MMSKTLRDDINDVVIARLHKALLAGEMVNVPDWADQLVQNLANIIQKQPKEKRARLVAYVGDRLDHYIRAESGELTL